MENKLLSTIDSSPELNTVVGEIASLVNKSTIIGFNLEADVEKNNGLVVLTVKSYIYENDFPRLDLVNFVKNYNLVVKE